MNRLLSASFSRLKNHKAFWLFTIFDIALAAFVLLGQYRQSIVYDYKVYVENIVMGYSMFIGIILSVFSSLFLGAEQSDGGIRNKISIGHKRNNIYLSNVITNSLVGIYFCALFMTIVASVGIPLFGPISIPLIKLFAMLGCLILLVITFSAIFTFFAMLITNKVVNAITSILFSFVLFALATSWINILNAPPMIRMATMSGQSDYDVIEMPNPKYPSEKQRKLYETLMDISPAGEAIQLANLSPRDLKVLPLYSTGITIVLSGLGLFIFKRKEFK